MPYPYQISTSAYLPDPYGTPGPYEHNGNLYCTLITENVFGSPDPNPYVRMYKSTDSGVTWAEQDAANKKHYEQTDTSTPTDTYRRGNKLYITYIPNGGTALSVAEFDMDTDLWGSVTTGGPVVVQNKRFKTFCLSDGSTLRCVYVDLHPTNSRYRVSVATCTAGVWGAGTPLFDPGTSETRLIYYSIVSVIMDDDNNIAVIGQDNNLYQRHETSLVYRWYSSAGSAGPYLRIACAATPYGIQGPCGFTSIIERSAGEKSLIFPMFSIQPNITGSVIPWYSAGLIAVDHGSAPVSAQHCNIDMANPGKNYTTTPTANSVWITEQSALFLYWPVESAYNSGIGESEGYEIRRSCTKLLTGWTSPSTVVSTTLSKDSRIARVCANRVGDSIGVAFSANADNGTSLTYRFPHYWQETIPTCSATGCGGNINSVR